MQGTIVSMLNVYYPPAHPSDFITKTFQKFVEIQSEIAIVSGDINCILDQQVDRFPGKTEPLSNQAKSLTAVCEDRVCRHLQETAPHKKGLYPFFYSQFMSD